MARRARATPQAADRSEGARRRGGTPPGAPGRACRRSAPGSPGEARRPGRRGSRRTPGVDRLSHSRCLQLGRLPARRVEAGHLLEDGRRHVGTAGRDLVALGGAGDVLHQEREPTRLGLDLGQVDRRHPGTDPGGDLAVEADLYFVRPQGEARCRDSGRQPRRTCPRRWTGPAPGSSSVKVKRVVSAIWPVPIGRRLEGAHRDALRQLRRPSAGRRSATPG